MSEIGMVALAAVSAAVGAGIMFVRQGRPARGRNGEPVTAFDADLEVQLTRARSIPGAEALLARLSCQPIIFTRELADFAAQLDNLERKAKVEDARQHAAAERRAPMLERAAKEAVAKLTAARKAPGGG